MKRKSIDIAVLGIFLFVVVWAITVRSLREDPWVQVAGYCGAIWGVLAILDRAIGPDRITEKGSLVLGVVVGALIGAMVVGIPMLSHPLTKADVVLFWGSIGGVIIGCIAGVITRKSLRKDKSKP